MEISVKQSDVSRVHSILVDNQVKFLGNMSCGIDKLYKFTMYDLEPKKAAALRKIFRQAKIKIY